MAKKTKQSIHAPSTVASSNCAIHWDSQLKGKLAKLGQPALLEALHTAVECSIDQFIGVDELVECALVNPHPFTEAHFPLDMPDLYAAYKRYDWEVCKDADGNPDFDPTLEGYTGLLVVSKLWKLCDSATNSERQVFTPATVTEITGICLLAEHAQRIRSSEYRATAAQKLSKPFWWKRGKKASRQREKFWDKAEKCLHGQYISNRCLGQCTSIDIAAMNLCETDLIPYSFLECFRLLNSFEEQM